MQVVDCSDGLVPAFTRWTVPSGITRWMVESAASSSPVHVSISRGGGHLGTFGLTVAMDRDALGDWNPPWSSAIALLAVPIIAGKQGQVMIH